MLYSTHPQSNSWNEMVIIPHGHSGISLVGTAERQLRAYVSIEECTLTRLDGAAKAQAVLIIRNTGQTPAYGFRMRAQTDLAAYPLAVELVPLAVEPAIAVLGPGGARTITAETGRLLNDAERERLERGETAVYLHGAINWRSSFTSAAE